MIVSFGPPERRLHYLEADFFDFSVKVMEFYTDGRAEDENENYASKANKNYVYVLTKGELAD